MFIILKLIIINNRNKTEITVTISYNLVDNVAGDLSLSEHLKFLRSWNSVA